MLEQSGTGSERQEGSRTPVRRMLRLVGRAGAGLLVMVIAGVTLMSCAVRPPKPGSIDGVSRLAALDDSWEGLEADVTVTWDEHLIPSITAASDADAAYAIGLVHAHLRLSQMEFLRRVSQGRLAEMAGPLVAGIDEAIRAIHLDRAVDEMQAGLPDDTRLWLERYVEGINAYQRRVPRRPADARTLGFDYAESWTVRDVLVFGRLASVDVNWGRWLMLLGLEGEQGYDDFVTRLWGFGDAGIPSFGGGSPHDLRVLTDIGRSGSNAFAVSGARSVSGGALVASDPHLGLPQPNIWCIVGYRTPDRAAVGLTIPGLPFILVGRNEQIAWTGTNMQSSSTVLYRLSEGWQETDARKERIRVRWWFDRERTIRDSEHGPVVTDAKLLRRLGAGDIAMRWRGHAPSDEASAFLRASAALTWDEFRAAFATYAAGGQNMLYGDAAGNIGQLMAIEAVPAAAAASRLGVVDASDDRYVWTDGIPSDRLPAAYAPNEGFLVSANNVPILIRPTLTPQGNANDRVSRMSQLLSSDRLYTLDDLAAIQLDTYSAASHRLAGLLVDQAGSLALDARETTVLDAIARWDGRYDADSAGAVSYQILLSALLERLYSDRYSGAIVNTIRAAPYVHDFVYEDLSAEPDPDLLRGALEQAARGFVADRTWGDLHRLRLAHPIGAVPLLGRGYVFEEVPQDGSTTTVYKSAHRVQPGQHNTTFGACARLLCDMGTLDDNRVVLLGGQDGWLGSDRLLDQLSVWQRGGTVPLPLSSGGQRERAVATSALRASAD